MLKQFVIYQHDIDKKCSILLFLIATNKDYSMSYVVLKGNMQITGYI